MYCTTLDTLTKYRDSFFGAMFSGYIALKPTKSGMYFIDRDGNNFHYILNYLRTGELIIPENKPHLAKMLLLEAEFYQVFIFIYYHYHFFYVIFSFYFILFYFMYLLFIIYFYFFSFILFFILV